MQENIPSIIFGALLLLTAKFVQAVEKGVIAHKTPRIGTGEYFVPRCFCRRRQRCMQLRAFFVIGL